MDLARNCPACGAAMTRGWASLKRGERKARPFEVWVCDAPGCGKGTHIGNLLDTTRDLRRLDLGARKENAMTTKGTTKLDEKGWGGKYAACVKCGTTEKTHIGRGLCSTCYSAVKRGGDVKPRGPRAVGPGGAGARTVALTVYVPEGVHARLVAVAAFLGTAPAELVAELVAKRFEGAKA